MSRLAFTAVLAAVGGVFGGIAGLFAGFVLGAILHAFGLGPSYANSVDWPASIGGLVGVGVGIGVVIGATWIEETTDAR